MSETTSEQRLTLQGRLAGPEVAQLQSCWNETRDARAGRTCVIDVTNLTAVDAKGEELLQSMLGEGAKFHACGVYIKHVMQSLSMRCRHHCN